MKKILSLALVVMLLVSALAGCGEADKPSKNVLGIGGIGPLTGPAASYGMAVKKGAELAVDEINASGGVNGIKFELVFADDEHDAEKSINAYNKIKNDGAKVLVGTVTSTPCIAVLEEAYKDNMFLLTPSGSAVGCIARPNAFRVCFSDPNQGIASAQYIADNGLAKKVAVMYDSSDVYSVGIYEKFAAEAQATGLEIVATEAFTKDSSTDFSVQLQRIKESGAELIFLPVYYENAALILTQASKIGIEAKYFGCDGLDGLIDQLGENAALAEGVMLLTSLDTDAKDEAAVKFTKAYKEKFCGETPLQFAADGYDAVYIIKAAIEKAGITDVSAMDMSALCDALVPVMTEIEVAGVTGTMMWDADGEPTKEPKVVVIKDGSYKVI